MGIALDAILHILESQICISLAHTSKNLVLVSHFLDYTSGGLHVAF